MAAPTIVAVMQAIEARLATIAGLRVTEYVPDQVTPPQAIVGVPPITAYHLTGARGYIQLEPTVMVLTSAAQDRAGQLALAAYANPTGASSVIVAIEADKTLGGVVDDCLVVDFQPLGLQEVALVGYYGGIFTLRVLAQGA